MYQHIFIDNKKITIISAKRKKNAADVFVIRTDVRGQLNALLIGKEYTVADADGDIFNALLTEWYSTPRLETACFKIIGKE